jgi:hypothetical protein
MKICLLPPQADRGLFYLPVSCLVLASAFIGVPY